MAAYRLWPGRVGFDLWAFLNRGVIGMTALGQLWYSLHPGSLNLVQAVIERYVHTFLWDPIIISVLLAPAALLFLGIGILLALVFRKRKRPARPVAPQPPQALVRAVCARRRRMKLPPAMPAPSSRDTPTARGPGGSCLP